MKKRLSIIVQPSNIDVVYIMPIDRNREHVFVKRYNANMLTFDNKVTKEYVIEKYKVTLEELDLLIATHELMMENN